MWAIGWTFLRSVLWGPAVTAATWLLADWRRLAVVLLAAGYVAVYLIADHQRAVADKAAFDQKLADVTSIFTKAADAARAAEQQRQASVGQQVTTDFAKKIAAQDAADAAVDAALQKEIADDESKLAAAGPVCGITADDLGVLRN